ncbi:MAG: chromosome segregation protein SMC [Gemmatimonadales bacterium]|nr:MAG: chromosome segregation protein SMC [Gemmatimonadales bacterium]
MARIEHQTHYQVGRRTVKINSLTLSGFKSFADKTKIEFHGGITAVVGPNGCGKSNISDALRWVLGEQRASAIRGSRMDEAIFHGTANRKPIHRAEVELRIANEDGILPVPYPEVAIGRTVLRGGESVYEINGQTVRLRDVQDLCRDTGLGANAYSIIEARMIDAILSDRPEERRALFEEAAEVGRYKDRRRTALRRLDQAHADLQRLDDVIGEVANKVRSLSRQRGRATKFGELRQRRLVLEVAVAADSLDAIEVRLLDAERVLEQAHRSRPEAEAALARDETEVEALRLHLVERERERGQLASQLESVRIRLEEIERQRLLTDERVTAARTRIEAIGREQGEVERNRESAVEDRDAGAKSVADRASELVELREKETDLVASVGALRVRRQELENIEVETRNALTAKLAEISTIGAAAEARRERGKARATERSLRVTERAESAQLVLGLEKEAQESQARLVAARDARQANDRRLEEARMGLRSARDETRQLRDRFSSLEGELASVSARAGGLAGMLSAGKDLPPIVARLQADKKRIPGVRGVLAEFMDVPASLSRAVEAQLGPLLFCVVVDDWKAVLAVRAWLSGRDETDGLLLLPLEPGPSRPGEGGSLNAQIATHGVGETWVRALLDSVDVASGEEFGPASGSWVAGDGSGRDRLGAVRLGQPSGGKGLLRRRTEHRELEERRAELETECSELRAALDGLETDARMLAEQTASLDNEREVLTKAEREAETTAEATTERLERTNRRIEDLDSWIDDLGDDISPDVGSDEADEILVEGLTARRIELEGELTGFAAESANASDVWEAEREVLQELRLQIARREADHAAEASRVKRAENRLAELDDHKTRLDAELTDRRNIIERGTDQLEGSEEELERLFGSRSELETQVRDRMEGLEERRTEVERREAALRVSRAGEREASEQRHALELERTELRGKSSAVRERIETEWERSLDELRTEVAPPDGNPDSWADELLKVRGKLSSIGPVNMLAATEYEEEKERLDFLEAQKADLISARTDLHDSIRRINETASTAFHEVFKAVRANFREIFVTLFEGGEADVWLENPDDPLDSAIEISASPRGKRTQRIHLLSGGERTLTALGLLFAIYLAKPSPFCVMDEVDAPLDESNIERFTAMLERFKRDTQFLIITHNARTIEVADFIYGVTMQEPGVTTLVALDLKGMPKAATV